MTPAERPDASALWAIADMHQLTVLDATTLRAAALLHNVAALCALPTLT